jgi:hypothetical protein
MSDQVRHKLAINDLLSRFFQAFDEQNWRMLRECLCEEVFTDHFSSRAAAAITISGDRYVELQRAALEGLDMLHNFQNLRVEVDAAGETARARCNYTIHRFRWRVDGGDDQPLRSYGYYLFTFARVGGMWRISGVIQNQVRNEGGPAAYGIAGGRGRMN